MALLAYSELRKLLCQIGAAAPKNKDVFSESIWSMHFTDDKHYIGRVLID